MWSSLIKAPRKEMCRNQKGFSVLELLIALALGLLVVAGIIQLFVGNSRTYEIVNAQSRLQENARFAFDFISERARSAGYFGCAPEDTKIARHLTGNWNLIPEYNITEPVDGWESNGDSTFVPDDLVSLPRTSAGANTFVHVDGNGIDRTELSAVSDILVFRASEQPLGRLATTLQPTGNPVVFTPGGTPSFAAEDVVLVSDCEQAALFKVTAVATVGDETTLTRAVVGGGLFDNDANITTPSGDVIAATLSIVGRSYGADAKISRVQSTFFFIADSAETNNRGEDVLALWQKSGSGAPVELVQGVEDMQVLYGVDTTDDNTLNVNQYQTIDDVVDVNDIVAVRVTLTVSSVDVLTENANQRLQRTYTKTIHVRNV